MTDISFVGINGCIDEKALKDSLPISVDSDKYVDIIYKPTTLTFSLLVFSNVRNILLTQHVRNPIAKARGLQGGNFLQAYLTRLSL